MAPTASPEKPPQSGEENAPEAATGVKRPASTDGDDGSSKKIATMDAESIFNGGCHCGRVRYTVTFDPASLKATRCNCTFCQKLSTMALSVINPDAAFKLVKPASKGEVDDYAPKTKSTESGNADGHRYFCGSCGVHCWAEGWYKFGGDHHNFFAVNLASIDQPQEGIDSSDVQVSYWDGLHDNQ